MNITADIKNTTMTETSEINSIITSPNKIDFQLFLDTPSNIHPYYRFQVEEKNQLNHEFLDQVIVLMKDELPVGRVAIYINPKLTYDGQICAGIGNYECINDPEVSQKLLETAIEYIQSKGISFVIGPFNGSIWDDYRFSEYHKSIGFFKEPFHPIYYNQQFIDFGFKPISRYASRINRDLHLFNHSTQDWTKKGITFRSIRMEHFEEELDNLYEFCMDAFSNNFLSTPISKEGFNNIYLPASNCVEGEFVIFAEDASGKLVGMIFGLIDFLHTEEKRLIIRTLGRKNDDSLKGLGAELIKIIYERAAANEVDAVIHAFMDFGEGQHSEGPNSIGEAYQTYVLYGRSIS